jgi:hypothetical protein
MNEGVYGYSPAVGEQVGKCELRLLKNAKSFLWFRIFNKIIDSLTIIDRKILRLLR